MASLFKVNYGRAPSARELNQFANYNGLSSAHDVSSNREIISPSLEVLEKEGVSVEQAKAYLSRDAQYQAMFAQQREAQLAAKTPRVPLSERTFTFDNGGSVVDRDSIMYGDPRYFALQDQDPGHGYVVPPIDPRLASKQIAKMEAVSGGGNWLSSYWTNLSTAPEPANSSSDHRGAMGILKRGWNTTLDAGEFFFKAFGPTDFSGAKAPIYPSEKGGAALFDGATFYLGAKSVVTAGRAGEGSFIRQTGARQILDPDSTKAWDKVDGVYDAIRANSADVSVIAKNTGLPEARISRIKQHVFFKEHQLDSGLRRFDADIDMANSWNRLEKGDFVKSDLDLLEHERFEAKFESIFKTNYRTAHDAAIRSGRTWTPE
jgi:hypothetical protein